VVVGSKPLLGAHLSISGGIHRALEEARRLRCTAVQFFTHSTVQWAMKPLAADAIAQFQSTLREGSPLSLVVHAGYLPNLASPERPLRERSIRCMIDELQRCEALGVPSLVCHPGAHMGAGEAWGLRRITGALRRILRATRGYTVQPVLENTAGQGTNLGYDFAPLGRIIAGLPEADRVGVCLDTAHAFAAGYDLREAPGAETMWDELDQAVGLSRLRAMHLNDSKREVGSRVDRHTHIGKGEIGKESFGRLMRDPRFARVPKIIETPKVDDMDRKNLRLLRRMAKQDGGAR